jgi:hypothetical protein
MQQLLLPMPASMHQMCHMGVTAGPFQITTARCHVELHQRSAASTTFSPRGPSDTLHTPLGTVVANQMRHQQDAGMMIDGSARLSSWGPRYVLTHRVLCVPLPAHQHVASLVISRPCTLQTALITCAPVGIAKCTAAVWQPSKYLLHTAAAGSRDGHAHYATH